jgi:NAD-dependent SIR2 family protein deacetylase
MIRGYDDAVQCKECGKIYWNSSRRCFDDNTPYYCRRCGAQLLIRQTKIIRRHIEDTAFSYNDTIEIFVVNKAAAAEIVAKKILFWWKVRKDGAENATD